MLGMFSLPGCEETVMSSSQLRRLLGDDRVIVCFCRVVAGESDAEVGAWVTDVIVRGVNSVFSGSGSSSLSGSCEMNLGSFSWARSGAEGMEKGRKDVRRDESAGSGACRFEAEELDVNRFLMGLA